MPYLRVPDLRAGYKTVVGEVMREGEVVTVRGQDTLELLDLTIELEDPTDSLPTGVGRTGLSKRIAAVEALQLIGGVSHPDMMVKAGGDFMAGVRDGGVFHGAYGPRVRAQLPAVVDRLRGDPQTRQALVVLWDPLHDLMVPDSHDYPCTVMLQFLIREDRLQLHTTMRSNDLWLGLPYDVFQFTQLQQTVANVLELELGHYYHHAVSAHIYARDVSKAHELHWPTLPREDLPHGLYGRDMAEAMSAARDLLTGDSPDWNCWDPAAVAGVGWFEQQISTLL